MGLGNFAGGLARGAESGMRMYMAKQQADREQADWQQRQNADKGSQAILNRDQTQQFNPNQIANAAQSSGDVGTWADQNDPSKGLVYANAPTDAGPSQGTSVAPQYGLGGTVQATPFTPIQIHARNQQDAANYLRGMGTYGLKQAAEMQQGQIQQNQLTLADNTQAMNTEVAPMLDQYHSLPPGSPDRNSLASKISSKIAGTLGVPASLDFMSKLEGQDATNYDQSLKHHTAEILRASESPEATVAYLNSLHDGNTYSLHKSGDGSTYIMKDNSNSKADDVSVYAHFKDWDTEGKSVMLNRTPEFAARSVDAERKFHYDSMLKAQEEASSQATAKLHTDSAENVARDRDAAAMARTKYMYSQSGKDNGRGASGDSGGKSNKFMSEDGHEIRYVGNTPMVISPDGGEDGNGGLIPYYGKVVSVGGAKGLSMSPSGLSEKQQGAFYTAFTNMGARPNDPVKGARWDAEKAHLYNVYGLDAHASGSAGSNSANSDPRAEGLARVRSGTNSLADINAALVANHIPPITQAELGKGTRGLGTHETHEKLPTDYRRTGTTADGSQIYTWRDDTTGTYKQGYYKDMPGTGGATEPPTR